jgi:hypothetical protein
MEPTSGLEPLTCRLRNSSAPRKLLKDLGCISTLWGVENRFGKKMCNTLCNTSYGRRASPATICASSVTGSGEANSPTAFSDAAILDEVWLDRSLLGARTAKTLSSERALIYCVQLCGRRSEPIWRIFFRRAFIRL